MTEWNPDLLRKAIERFARDENAGSVTKWEKDADISQGVLRKFLKGDTQDISVSAVIRLAQARRTSVGQLLGETAVIDTNLLVHVIAELDRMLEESGVKVEAVDREQKARAIAALYEATVRDEETEIAYRTVARMLTPARTQAPRREIPPGHAGGRASERDQPK
jgi:hypothetical protein